jgi:hypothetical protein
MSGIEVNLGNYLYNTKHLVGQGSYAKVYTGKAVAFDEPIAVKVISLVNLSPY